MKLRRDDFKIIEIEGLGDNNEFLVQKRFFFLNRLRTKKFRLMMNSTGDAPFEYFKSKRQAENFINLYLKYKK